MRGALLVVLLAVPAWADVPPPPQWPDTSCVGQAEGTSCGTGGTCRKLKVRRPDFSSAGVPTWVVTEVMICEGGRPAWRVAVLAGLLGLAFLAWRRRPGARQAFVLKPEP